MDSRLIAKLNDRKKEGTLRSLSFLENGIDFLSNDYLGLARIPLNDYAINLSGGTGSRLMSGSNKSTIKCEKDLAAFFKVQSALVYNSGYDCNIGFFSAVPQKDDWVFYDQKIHASVIDGLRLSFAQKKSFLHNNISDLQKLLERTKGTKYIVVESLYSMDGDFAPLWEIAKLAALHDAYLIVDEAHSVGLFGESGRGVVDALGLNQKVFARIVTFGKAYGLHGACVLGSEELIHYLVNFSRSFIYTTALSPAVYEEISKRVCHMDHFDLRIQLQERIAYFREQFSQDLIKSDLNSPIQMVRFSSKEDLIRVQKELNSNGFCVKSIFSPTVLEGEEGLRLSFHAFNTQDEIDLLVNIIRENLL